MTKKIKIEKTRKSKRKIVSIETSERSTKNEKIVINKTIQFRKFK